MLRAAVEMMISYVDKIKDPAKSKMLPANTIGRSLFVEKDQAHADHATRQAQDAKQLHVPDQAEPMPDIFNLRQVIHIFFLFIGFIQTPDQGSQSQKPVGISQHNQGQCRKE
jgi:hypothetical protein